METLHVKLDQINGNELILREGQASTIHEPVKISLSGDLDSISAFLTKRADGFDLQAVDKSKVVVLVDRKAMTINLRLDPQNKFGTDILGILELSEQLKVFAVNTGKMFKREELINVIRFNKLAFDNKEQHDKVLKAYMSFEATQSQDIKAANDTRGNRTAFVDRRVSTNIPTEFTLNIPIFKGKESNRFHVEICLDVTDGGARFWFESVELHEIIETTSEVYINEQLKFCKDFVIINK